MTVPLNSSGRTRLIYFKVNYIKKRKNLFSFGFKKKNHPKKYQESKSFIYKKQVFINWFIKTQFLVMITTEWNIEPRT